MITQVNSCRNSRFGARVFDGGVTFCTFAPGASAVYLVGDLCDWEVGLPMARTHEEGVFEISLPKQKALGSKYKYRIVTDGGVLFKADPYAVLAEGFPKTASVVCDLGGYIWRDETYLQYRRKYVGSLSRKPMNIYEVDLASWKRGENGEPLDADACLRELSSYVKQLGYTHIELINLLEGTQAPHHKGITSSFFAPRSELFEPCELMRFVDSMHEAGIGVIVDIPLTYASRDEQGLCAFDGQALYESDNGAYELWDRAVLDFGKPAASQLIYDCCFFWAELYHVDGITLCGVSEALESELYRRTSTQKLLARLCLDLKEAHPDVLLICGESLSDEYEAQRIGFDIERETTFASDIVTYSQIDPIFRKYDHERVTLSHVPLADKKCILPLWHGELSEGRGTLISRAFGDYWQKFAGVRALLGFMYLYPGKKLTFMGTEIGQFDECEPAGELQWSLLDYEAHAKLQRYCAELGQLYLQTPELWELDGDSEGFGWIDTSNRDQSIVSFYRADDLGNTLVAVVNFTPVVYENFRVGVPVRGEYREIFNSDDERYGGSGVLNTAIIKSEPRNTNWLENSINIRIPPMAITVLKCVRRTQAKTRQITPITRKIIKK